MSAARQLRRGAFERVEQRRIGDEAALHDLGQPGGPLAHRQRVQEADVGDHRLGLMERPDQVFARGEIHPGLAPYRGVDHRQQRRRAERERHPTQVDRRGEPGVIGRGAAADPDDGGPTVVPARRQPLDGAFQLRQVLAGLAGAQVEALDVRQPRGEGGDQGRHPRRARAQRLVDHHGDAGGGGVQCGRDRRRPRRSARRSRYGRRRHAPPARRGRCRSCCPRLDVELGQQRLGDFARRPTVGLQADMGAIVERSSRVEQPAGLAHRIGLPVEQRAPGSAAGAPNRLLG